MQLNVAESKAGLRRAPQAAAIRSTSDHGRLHGAHSGEAKHGNRSCYAMQIYNYRLNRAYARLGHAIVIATKPHFRVTSSLNNKARFGGDNNSVT